MNLFTSETSKEKVHLPLEGATIHYYPHFFNEQEASQLFQQLLTETDWKQDDIKVFGKIHPQPRLTALYGEKGKTYGYSGITMSPIEFTPLLYRIKQRIETELNTNFTTVLLNLYRDGKDSNGWHSDNEKELGDNPVIASVTFGAKRRFQLKHKRKKNQKYQLVLNHGSLLVMQGVTQHNWNHQIPKTKKEIAPRINLTFRIIKSNV